MKTKRFNLLAAIFAVLMSVSPAKAQWLEIGKWLWNESVKNKEERKKMEEIQPAYEEWIKSLENYIQKTRKVGDCNTIGSKYFSNNRYETPNFSYTCGVRDGKIAFLYAKNKIKIGDCDKGYEFQAEFDISKNYLDVFSLKEACVFFQPSKRTLISSVNPPVVNSGGLTTTGVTNLKRTQHGSGKGFNSGYIVVKIGTQTWRDNLDYDADGSKCYDNNSNNCNTYGRLYNWDAAKKACPSGWHLPTDAEWTTLINYAGGSSNAGLKLKSARVWPRSGNGTDDYKFSALPGGYGDSNGKFYGAGSSGYWWSASEFNSSSAYIRSMNYSEGVDRSYYDKSRLFSVRCVQD